MSDVVTFELEKNSAVISGSGRNDSYVSPRQGGTLISHLGAGDLTNVSLLGCGVLTDGVTGDHTFCAAETTTRTRAKTRTAAVAAHGNE